MVTSASLQESQELLADFEEFHALLQIAFGQPRIAKKRTTLVVFEYQEDFEPYKPLAADGQRRNVAAYFLGHPEESLIAMVAGPASAGDVREIVYHEYVHHFFDLMGYELPLWLNEGLADLFSTMLIRRNRLELGHSKPEYMNVIRGAWNLDWLFKVSHGSDAYHGGIAQQQFYAQSWALVHFWFTSQEMFPGYLKFLELIEQSGKGSAECMEEAFGMNTEQMKKALDDYLNKGSYQLRQLPLDKKPTRKRYAFRKATEFEEELALLNLEARAVGMLDSEIKLLALAERHPGEPRPYEVLGALAGRHGRPQEQLQYYAKAVEMETPNSHVQTLRARLVLDRVDVASSLDYRMPEAEADPLRQGLRAGFEVNPNHDEIIKRLAYLESVAAKPNLSSVELVQRQIKSMRDSRETLLSLAVIRWRIKDYATAETILNMIRHRKALEGPAQHRMEILEHRLAQAQASD